MGPDPAVAQVRLAVRGSITGLAPGSLVLAACSGGADSLALAAALAFEAPRCGLRAGGVTIDHGLQDGSAGQARTVVTTLTGLGLAPVLSIAVTPSGPGGPEATARTARYAALDTAADQAGAAAVLLGHTLDDQAETVLLGLARGSGARSLSGMAPAAGRYLRPLLEVPRAATGAACAAQGLAPWQDPHNSDPAYTRVRVRRQVLPALAQALGPGVAAALARSARQLRDDADVLEALAATELARLRDRDGQLDTAGLAALPAAIRTRVLHLAAAGAGCPPGALTARHVASLDALVTSWRGQRGADLPGFVRGTRRYGKLIFTGQPGSAENAENAEDAGGRD